MRTRLKLKPGAKGTKRLVEQYGEQLYCVRYRYDELTRKRIKTVELIIEEVPWSPSQEHDRNDLMAVHVDTKEISVHELIKAAGGRWNHNNRTWSLPYDKVVELGCQNRVIGNRQKKN